MRFIILSVAWLAVVCGGLLSLLGALESMGGDSSGIVAHIAPGALLLALGVAGIRLVRQNRPRPA